MSNYALAPFLFTWPGFQICELDKHEEAGETWRVLEVIHPDNFPTHSSTQRFYFDKGYRIRRLDYETKDITNGGSVSHYCFDHERIDGMIFPMLRRAITAADGFMGARKSLVLLNLTRVKVYDTLTQSTF